MISIIIPTFNKSTRLHLCLHYLSQIKTEFDFEVIIVNDGSTDDTSKMLNGFFSTSNSRKKFKVINTQNNGRAAARNIGVEKSKFDIILFLDDDIIIKHKTLESHIKLHHSSDMHRIVHEQVLHVPYFKAFADPCAIPECSSSLKSLYQKILLSTDFDINTCCHILKQYSKESKFEKLIRIAAANNNFFQWLCFVGGNTSIKKTLFYKAKGFDENFQTTWGCEDIELGYRLFLIGKVEFLYDYSVSSYHLDHFRVDYQAEHKINMKYFTEKHKDKRLTFLELYFQGQISEKDLLKLGIW